MLKLNFLPTKNVYQLGAFMKKSFGLREVFFFHFKIKALFDKANKLAYNLFD